MILLNKAEIARRRQFLEQVNAAYAAIAADTDAWEALDRERRQWDVTIADGLTDLE